MKRILLFCLLICTIHIKAQIITTVVGTGYGAGNGQGNYSGDGGVATNAEIHGPAGVVFDKGGNLYVVESGNMAIRKVSPTDTITKYAGKPLNWPHYNGDNGNPDTIQLGYPLGCTFDSKGNFYYVDQDFNVIRKINKQHVMSIVAGNHHKYGDSGGYGGDGGLADSAGFYMPSDVTFDKYDNMYIADAGNNLIRKVDTLGIITTIAGDTTGASSCSGSCNQGYNGDNISATTARLNMPMGVTFDKVGNLYIADYNNSLIRKINTSGIITSVAGAGSPGYSGDGGQATLAKLSAPRKVCFDSYDNMYIAEENNQVIRKVNTGGIISTFAGTGGKGYTGNNGPATSATLNQPWYVVCDTLNNLYIADYYNNVIRKVNIPNPNPQWFVVPDANFANYLRTLIPSAMQNDSLNTSSSLVTTTTYTINLQNSFISNLAGVQYFTSLTYLNCEGNQLTSIPTLPNSLITFDCSYNYNLLTSLPTLPTSLQFLGCHDNALTSLPILPNTLQTLYCDFNKITCFPNIPNSVVNLIMHNNPYNCLPNYIASMGSDTLTYPLCAVGNTNGCAVATSINKVSKENILTIYPNPTQNNFIIETNNAEKQTLQLHDVNGKLILTQTLLAEKTNVDVSNLSQGVYNVSLSTNEGVVNKRLVIVK